MKTYTSNKGASMPKEKLNAYSVGLMRLSEMKIPQSNFSDVDIEYIGYCSIKRREVVIGKIGNFWGVRGRMDEQCDKARSFGRTTHFRAYWIVSGKHTMALRPHFNKTVEQIIHEYEGRDRSKPLHEMGAEEIFNTAKEKKPSRRHTPKARFQTQFAYRAKMERV